MKLRKLCLLRLSAIGDVCHATALVERITRHAPEIEITWIIGKIEYQLLKGMSNVRFIVFDKKQGKQSRLKLKEALEGQHFDALFLMQVAFRANWVSRLIKADVKIGFDWHRSKELHWLFANKRVAKQLHAHVLDGFMAFADALEIPPVKEPGFPIPLSHEEQEMALQLKQKLTNYVVISPAASKAERNWLPEGYAEVAEYMFLKGYAVVLTGGPADIDRRLGEQIELHCKTPLHNLIGETSLKQMLAVLGEASLVIAPDTGPAHMATTVSTPVIGLYAHSNPRRTGPYNNLDNVVSVYDQVIEQQTGKPWSQLPWGKRAKGAHLMSLITADEVKAQIDSLL